MNLRKTIFVVGGLGIILILLVLRFGGLQKFSRQKEVSQVKTHSARKTVRTPVPAQVKKALPEPSAVKKAPPPPSPAPKPPQKKLTGEEQALGVGDPFSYAGTGSGDYAPLSGNKHVGNITVKGIICMKGGEPRAVLHLKESGRVHYVSKNSVIRVSAKGKKGTAPAEAYIVVKEIRSDEVELIQLERPDKVIIIR